jgi:uncharacterized membrane protein YphA (DoxX/SURF4 family)
MAIGGDDDQEGVRPVDGRSQPWRDRRTDPAWPLLPQRLFLGVTFAYAGLDKLADRSFFDPASPTSIQGQIAAVRDTSPLGPLLRATSQHSSGLGVLIALAELAVGVATLLGGRVRLAAAGGALVSLSLLLTVTWATRPYYYGSDIVFRPGRRGLRGPRRACEPRCWSAWPSAGRPGPARSSGTIRASRGASAASSWPGGRSSRPGRSEPSSSTATRPRSLPKQAGRTPSGSRTAARCGAAP